MPRAGEAQCWGDKEEARLSTPHRCSASGDKSGAVSAGGQAGSEGCALTIPGGVGVLCSVLKCVQGRGEPTRPPTRGEVSVPPHEGPRHHQREALPGSREGKRQGRVAVRKGQSHPGTLCFPPRGPPRTERLRAQTLQLCTCHPQDKAQLCGTLGFNALQCEFSPARARLPGAGCPLGPRATPGQNR